MLVILDGYDLQSGEELEDGEISDDGSTNLSSIRYNMH